MPKVANDDKNPVKEITNFDELKALMETDPAIAEQVLKDLDALESGAVDPVPTDDTGAGDGADDGVVPDDGNAPTDEQNTEASGSETPDNQPVDDVEEEVVVKIKPSWLHTYGKNRSADEAVFEMSKGVKEKDRTIDFLRKEKIPSLEELVRAAQTENVALKSEIEKFKVGKESAQTEPQDEVLEEVVIPEIPPMPKFPTGEDAFDEAKMNEYKTAIEDRDRIIQESYEARNKKSQQETKAELNRIRKDITGELGKVKQTQDIEKATSSRKDSVLNEYTEIDSFRSRNPEVLGGDRSIQEIESDFIKYMEDLALAAGINGGIYKEDGRTLREEIRRAVQMHQDDSIKEGEQLRNNATDRGIKAPEDLDVLNKIYTIRAIRKQYGSRDAAGNFVPMDWDDAFVLAKKNHPELTAENKFQSQVETENKRNKAIENRKGFARETKVGAGQGQLDVSNFPTQQFDALMAKNSSDWTETEKESLRAIARHFNMRPEEIHPVLAEKTK